MAKQSEVDAAQQARPLPVSSAWEATHAAVVTPSDATVLTAPSRLWIGTAGDLVVVTAGGETVTFPAFPAGWFPVQVVKVLAATTATNIRAVW